MNNQNLLQTVHQLAKASAQWPEPENVDDDQSMDDYLTSLVDPDDPDPDSSSVSALRDSAMVGLHLAKSKLAILQKDHAKVHQNLNKAMAFHARLHGHINAAARQSEMEPMRIREEHRRRIRKLLDARRMVCGENPATELRGSSETNAPSENQKPALH